MKERTKELLSTVPFRAADFLHGNNDAADYGIDAPGLRRAMLGAGTAGSALAGLATLVARRSSSTLATGIAVTSTAAAFYGLGMGAYMTYGSRIGKLRTRDRLLDLARSLSPWTGRETVLDVGCGRGLMLIGAARRLTTGHAVGIDIWRAEDQAANTPDATRRNARIEGVSDRIRLETADARNLPFDDASFDLVMSHWVVHNLPDPASRTRAIDEMLRVLRPRGVLLLADIAHHADYLHQLTARGLTDTRIDTGGPASRLIGVLSGGSFRPRAIVARRPESGRFAGSGALPLNPAGALAPDPFR